jgi:predicted AlkP superfamily pyrophosphatase or phosphodiesterase
MPSLLRALAALVASAVLASCASAPPKAPAAATAPTILISIDGFRPDYLDRGVTPNLAALAAEGVRGDMRPSFPSKTFPNHYTLVTGLRPDRNGIVDNNMQDAAIPGVTFKMSNAAAVADARWWNEGEPIWVTAEKAGLRTATEFWPGSEAAIHGVRPSRWTHFDEKVPSAARVDQVLAWLDLPAAERPVFLTLYFDAVDTAGHWYGPESAQVNAAAAEVDAAVGRLEAGLKARGLTANLVVVADHGMAPISPDRRIFADDLVAPADVKSLTLGAFWSLNPAPGRETAVERALLKPHAHMQCWRKGEIPARYHYGHNPRVPAIFCLPATGWEITTHDYKAKHPEGGDHGFDNFSPEMRAVFIAAGPAFRRHAALPTFDNVDVYPLLAHVLGVKPQPNDGRLADVAGALAR